MVKYERFTLDNGLRVILHKDDSTPFVAVNVLYDVGSKDENPERTGFAHLFEHLMFGGSLNVPNFDVPIQEAGGENNAFTNSDSTNFFDILPSQNLEIALWLESDRMKQLIFSQDKLDVQKKVVIEEFKETCLNEPYGDMWHHLSELCFEAHSYKWPTIGKDIKHIEQANLEDVKEFFYKFYRPNNAILTICGNVEIEESKLLINNWFSDIERGEQYRRNLPKEESQTNQRKKHVKGNVPSDAIYVAFKIPERTHPDYYAYDLLTDILSEGRSSRLYQKLQEELQLFSMIDAYITGTNDPGLLIVEGRLMTGVSFEEAEKAIWESLNNLIDLGISEMELWKVKNKTESNILLSELSVMNKAISLAYYESIGNIDLINDEIKMFGKVTSEDIIRVAKHTFNPAKSNILYYHRS